MDDNNWRANSGETQVPGQVMAGEAPAAPGMDAGDWRTQLHSGSRESIVNMIMDILKRNIPFSRQERLQELKEIAVRFEEKIYTGATSKIGSMMQQMATKAQNSTATSCSVQQISSHELNLCFGNSHNQPSRNYSSLQMLQSCGNKITFQRHEFPIGCCLT